MKKRIFLICISLLFVALIVWRLWLLKFTDIVPCDIETYDMVSIRTLYHGNEEYVIDEMDSDTEDAIMELLNTSSYRQSFRNLWPRGVSGVFSDRYYDGNEVDIHFYYNDGKEYCWIHFTGSHIVSVICSEDPGQHIFYTTNQEMMYELIGYVKQNGAGDH